MQSNIDWNVYPRYILDELKALQRKRNGKNIDLPRFLFLCGRDISIPGTSNREIVSKFYKSSRFKNINCILAEELWEKDKKKEVDLLTFEDFLAEASDGIILFVESYGTACELGAFSMKENLIKKMLVFIDYKYKGTASFINDGPINKICNIIGSNVIYADLEAVLSNTETFNKLNEIISIKKCDINKDESQVKVNSFILEILELISLFGPIERKELVSIYKYMKDFENFTFVSEHNGEPLKKIQTTDIINFLLNFKLIVEDRGNLDINVNNFTFTNYMFDIDFNRFNFTRAKLLTRKYRHKAGVIA